MMAIMEHRYAELIANYQRAQRMAQLCNYRAMFEGAFSSFYSDSFYPEKTKKEKLLDYEKENENKLLHERRMNAQI